jgi:hypothetical protein
VKRFVGLLGLLSLFGLQFHSFFPHHHHDAFGSSHTHCHELSSDDVHPCELTSDHHHHHWDSHSDDVGTKPPSSHRIAPDAFAVLPTPFGLALSAGRLVPVRVSHPFVPFQTGPPGSVLSRGPPVA